MYEIKFDHDAPGIPEVIGITDARADEIIEHIAQAYEKTETHTTFMERAISLSDPKNEAEIFFIGYAIGMIMERQIKSAKDALAQVIADL